jgi:5-methylcytosine-specific restriction endonuclease McrA
VNRHEVDQTLEQAIAALRRLPYAEYLKTAHWQRVRALALETAGHACELCASTEALQVHHRTYERLGFEQPDDVITLCDDCHRDHHRALVLRAIRATERAPLAVSVSDVLDKIRGGGATP